MLIINSHLKCVSAIKTNSNLRTVYTPIMNMCPQIKIIEYLFLLYNQKITMRLPFVRPSSGGTRRACAADSSTDGSSSGACNKS